MADYTQTYIDNDMSKLNTVLQTLVTNDIVGAVDYDSSGTYAVFTFYADAEKTTEVFRITQKSGNTASYKSYTFKATASDGSTLSSTPTLGSSGYDSGFIIRYGYSTANGVYVSITTPDDTTRYNWLCFMITKNQDGDPVFIWTNRTSFTTPISTNINTEYIVASSDVAPLGTVSRVASTYQKQTLISPFFSCCDSEAVSYTPNAGRILAGELSDFIYNEYAHVIVVNGVTYITNGYWALKVG